MSEKINAQDILFVYGENDWSVVWHKDTGAVLMYGDHDTVYDWLEVALGIEQPDFIDTGWYDAAARRPMPLAELVPVGVFHAWAERALGRIILTPEFGTHKMTEELREHARPLIWAILPTLGEGGSDD